ncbi:EthD domain-containing protein [Croceicoccus mobilis]|uniref:EthD domain-containing protein n=1 Tax=Croceicoccus mobilis TaxID=1703339 RepID=A0A917DXS1_9SPHN|nr:EthD domain-containing protein [Croceicoccus mobilis]GGD78959.1 hypothetical protein GCM10010990_31050 [Croceicoccus mobilis]
MTITLMTIMRRRAGMSQAEFVDYYEAAHARIGEKVLAGHATRYVRRFLMPFGHDDEAGAPDVILEIDFPDREAMDAFFVSVADPAVAAMIAEDEERLFDRPSMRSYLLDERESALPPV